MSKSAKILSLFLAIILAAGAVVVGIGSNGFRNWDIKTWFQSGQIVDKDPPANVDGIITVPQSIQFCSALSEGTSEYEPQTVGVTITPENATIVRCEWSLEWCNDVAFPDPDGVVTDYVKFTATEDPLFVTVNCLKPFGKRINLKATVIGYGVTPTGNNELQEVEYNAMTEIGYNKRIAEMPFVVNCFSFGKQITLPQTPEAIINRVIGSEYGMTSFLSMSGLDVKYGEYTENTGIVGNYSVEYAVHPKNSDSSVSRTIDFGEIDFDDSSTYNTIDVLKRIEEYETERKDMYFGTVLSNGGYISVHLVIAVNGKSYRYNARANYIVPITSVAIAGWTDPGSNPVITF